MAKFTHIAFALCSGAVVFVACAAEKAATSPGPDAGLDAIVDGVADALADDAKVGTRLRPRFAHYAGPDGVDVKQFAGEFYDNVRAETCRFGVGADAKGRCLPSSMAVLTLDTYFVDAACKSPLYWRPRATCTSASPKYLGVVTGDACTGATKVVRITGTITGTIYTKDGSGGCTSGAGFPSGLGEAVTVEEVPASSFAELSYTVEG